MNSDLVRRYQELRRHEKELKAEAGACKEEADKIEEALLEEFASDGIDRITLDGKTVYLHRQVWVSALDGRTDEVAAALQECGLGHFVHDSYSNQSLSAYVRDMQREEAALPEALAAVVKVSETYRLRVRSS